MTVMSLKKNIPKIWEGKGKKIQPQNLELWKTHYQNSGRGNKRLAIITRNGGERERNWKERATRWVCDII